MTGSDKGLQFQTASWNAEQGRKWVEHDTALEQMHRAVTEPLVASARPEPGDRVIDIGCGSGWSTAAFGARTTDGHATGIDISTPLIDLARQRHEGNISFEIGDAQTFDFAPGAADLAVSRFGVMFFDDPVVAFANIRRALRPGGRYCAAAWAGVKDNPWFGVPMAAMAARIGPQAPPPLHAPGPMAFADADYGMGLLRDAGFEDVTVETRTCTLRNPDGAGAATALFLGVGPIGRIVRDGGGTDDDVAAIAQRITAGFDAYADGQGVAIPARIHFFHARNPGAAA